MKSLIRVDYKSRFGDGNFGDKEPLIRIDLLESDDPRDTLISEILKGETYPKIGASQINESLVSPDGKKTYVLYRKNDMEWLCEMASTAFSALAGYSGMENVIMVTSEKEFYFELSDNSKVRSKGTERMRLYLADSIMRQERDHEFVKRLAADWKDFEKIVAKRAK